MTNPKEFEVLAIDDEALSLIKSESNFLHSLLGNAEIFDGEGDPSLKQAEITVRGGTKIKVSEIKSDISKAHFRKAFLLKAKGKTEHLEPLRKEIVKHIREHKFNTLYILQDDISQEIACKLYPLVYRVENALRGYLMKFMSTQLGSEWWKMTVSTDGNKKVADRKNNEKVFSDFIDSKVYLIDFSDIGQIVYQHSSGFNSKEKIIERVETCEESVEALKRLKEELKSNYQKFFKEHFKDADFQKKWTDLSWYRNKIAHNGLFVAEDEDHATEIANSLLKIIKRAGEEMPNVEIEEAELEAMKEAIVDKASVSDTSSLLGELTEEVFLQKLSELEKHLTYVVFSHLINKLMYSGFNPDQCRGVAEKLRVAKKITFGEVPHPITQRPVTTIKSIA